jgi:GTPase SAR1 family protein
MVVKLRRPILVGGLALSFSLWILQSWHDSIVQLGEFSLLSILAVSGGLWLWKRKHNQPDDITDILPGDRSSVENAIAKAEVVIHRLTQEAETQIDAAYLASLKQQIPQLHTELDRQNINLAVTGGKSVGKTTLIQVLASNWQPETGKQVIFQETPALFTEVSATSDTAILDNTNLADYVLFLTNGDLTDTEYQTLQQLKAPQQRLTLVFNKQDQYLPEERASILQSLQQRMSCVVVATSPSPLPIKVRKHLDDGSVQEWMEQPAADIQQLTQQLGEMIAQRGQQLVWATTLRKAGLLQIQAKDCLNGIRRDRAQPTIEQYQWIAAAAAFANPIPVLDMVATAAISGQMIVDLGGVYQQKFSLEQAKTVAGEMGGLMLKLGLVELSTKAITTILKTNAITFVAGGLVEGLSAAYLTRLAGLSLVEYFQQQEIAVEAGEGLNIEKLRQTLQNVFQQNQQMAFMQGFVKQGVKHLLPESPGSELITLEKAMG